MGYRTARQRETHRISQQGYRARNRERLVEKQKAYSKTPEGRAKREAYTRRNPIRFLLAEARKRVKEKGLPFCLTVSDIVIPAFCPVLGIPIISGGDRNNWPSLDRHVPELGYVVGNVFVISYRANRLKNDATFEEVEKLFRYMKDRHDAGCTVDARAEAACARIHRLPEEVFPSRILHAVSEAVGLFCAGGH